VVRRCGSWAGSRLGRRRRGGRADGVGRGGMHLIGCDWSLGGRGVQTRLAVELAARMHTRGWWYARPDHLSVKHAKE
jgi:hypothetical protein